MTFYFINLMVISIFFAFSKKSCKMTVIIESKLGTSELPTKFITIILFSQKRNKLIIFINIGMELNKHVINNTRHFQKNQKNIENHQVNANKMWKGHEK